MTRRQHLLECPGELFAVVPGGTLGVDEVAHHGLHAKLLDLLHELVSRLDVGELTSPAPLRVPTRIGIVRERGEDAACHRARLGVAVNERDVEQAAHAMPREGVDVVIAVHTPGLALHVGQRTDEERAGGVVRANMRLATRRDDTGDQQVGNDRGEKRPRPDLKFSKVKE